MLSAVIPSARSYPAMPSEDNRNTSGAAPSVLSYWREVPSTLLRPRQIGTELSCDVLNPTHVPL
ncbi:MAG: hypothetical protein ACTS6A_03010 [Candidatus Hodgkinia cicadicola]